MCVCVCARALRMIVLLACRKVVEEDEGGINDNTVVISKSYLDQLLRFSQERVEQLQAQLHQHQPPEPLHHQSTPLPVAPPTNPSLPSPQHKPSSKADVVKRASPDFYFPFGRPGGGAPLRTDSGQVMADLRQRNRLQGNGGRQSHQEDATPTRHAPQDLDYHTPNPTTTHPQGGLQSSHQSKGGEVMMESPRYGRGAGPHVNEYVLREKEEKRKKELEHVVSQS